jgi:hypothetical protein
MIASRRSIARLAGALLLMAAGARAEEPEVEPAREALLPRVVTGFIRVKFTAGHLVVVRLADEWSGGMPAPADYRLELFDREGKPELVRAPGVEVEDATSLQVLDAEVAPNGILVVAMEAAGPGDRRPVAYLVEYDIRSGTLLRRLRTDPVACTELATEGEAIWCLGFDDLERDDAPLVYRFTVAGDLAGTLFPVNQLPGALYSQSRGPYSTLVAGDGHAAAWLLDRDDLLLWDERLTHARCVAAPRPAPPDAAGDDELAMLPGGRLLGWLVAPDQPPHARTPERALYEVSPSGACRPVPGFPRGLPYLLVGSDRGQLVFLDVPLGKLLWYPVAAEPGR